MKNASRVSCFIWVYYYYFFVIYLFFAPVVKLNQKIREKGKKKKNQISFYFQEDKESRSKGQSSKATPAVQVEKVENFE